MQLSKLSAATLQQIKGYLDTVILSVGAVESHGPHAPIGTDHLIAERIVQELDDRFSGRVLTLPSISYGHCFALKEHMGTIDIPNDVFRDFVYFTLRPFQSWGFSNIVLVNGHGGNMTALNQAAERLVEDGMTVLTSNWWLDYQPDIQKIAAGVGHGGEDETSVVMAIDSGLVDISKANSHSFTLPQGIRYPGMSHDLYPDGYSGNPAAATSEKGEQILRLVVERLSDRITTLWQGGKKS